MVQLQVGRGCGDDAGRQEWEREHLAQLNVDAQCRLAVDRGGLDGVRGDGADEASGREDQPAAHGGHEEADAGKGDGDPC